MKLTLKWILRSSLVPVMAFASVSMSGQLSSQQAAQEQMGLGPAAAQDQAAIQDAETGWYKQSLPTRDARLAWWRDARFGCFIHWGAYSVLGGEWNGKPNPGYAEHIMRVNQIPVGTYRDEVASRFHPDAFNAKEWVRTIKAAGMRYIVITAKHHDGFAIWPSTTNHYNILEVAHFQRDPLQELITAAHAEGLHVGFYYSHAFDWEDPNAPGNDWDYNNPGGGKNLFGGVDWYNKHPELLPRVGRYVYGKAIPQLQELVSRYHPDILWFDTPAKLPLFYQIAIVKAVRSAGPQVVINGRAARGDGVNFGDYQNTADRPAELRPTSGDWEAIPTTNESYGYNKLDNTYKPVSYFVQLLAKAAAKGGNILLNIGPRGDGTLNPPDVNILDGVGRWMDTNASSIRGTTRTPLDRQSWGESTVNGNTLYLHVFSWPQNGLLTVGGLQGNVESAYLLADKNHAELKTSATRTHDLTISLPMVAPDSVDSVIVLKMRPGWQAVLGRLLPSVGGTRNELLAFDAEAKGSGFTYGDGKTNRDYVDGLQTRGNSLVWKVRAPVATLMQFSIRYSVHHAGAKPDQAFVLTYKGQSISGPVGSQASDSIPTTIYLGTLQIEKGLANISLTFEGSAESLDVFEISEVPVH